MAQNKSNTKKIHPIKNRHSPLTTAQQLSEPIRITYKQKETKITQRTKTSPIIYRTALKINIPNRKEIIVPIKLCISPDDYNAIFKYWNATNTDVLDTFSENLFIPLVAFIESKKGPRGSKKKSRHFIDWLKTDACFLYVFLSHWAKQKKDERPNYITKIVEMATNEGWIIKGKNNFEVLPLTMFWIDKIYGKKIKQHQLKTVDDEENFYRTYIRDKRGLKIAKFFIDKKTNEQVKKLVYEEPLKKIFGALGIT